MLKKNRLKKITLILHFSGLLIVPMVLLILPADFFDEGQSICISVLLFDETCFGCGMTRAIQHLIHFNFSTAYSYNKLAIIVLPLLVYVWGKELYNMYNKVKK